MPRAPRFALLFLVASGICYAQPSPWQGEWGTFDPAATNGQRLTLSNCNAQTCDLEIEVLGKNQRCDTASHSSVTLLSPTDAAAVLPAADKTQSCKLQLHREESGNPAITITATGDACTSYYCTSPSVGFNRTYPWRSNTIYTGLHINQCFMDTSSATLATCSDSRLAALEQKWQDLYFDFPLQTPASKDEAPYSRVQRADNAILKRCDSQSQPAACLNQSYSSDIAAMTAKQQAYIQGYTERGDPAKAALVAATIAGHYRHRFPNGDVQGDKYISTDTLIITPVSHNSIHFDAHLEFYNGHECNLAGGALYRKDGSFVFDDDPENATPSEPACKLAIVPTPTGVKFRDLTGTCRTYCGARGGWDGAAFPFTERVPASPKGTAPKPTR